MNVTWNDNAPIYRQLRDRVVAMILDGVLKQGDPLPSVRQVAADFQINPITVSKAYQELVDENLVEKRRGLGMYVTEGARGALMKSERDRFLTHALATLGNEFDPSRFRDMTRYMNSTGSPPSGLAADGLDGVMLRVTGAALLFS